MKTLLTYVLLPVLILTGNTGNAQQTKDTLYFFNGSTMIGEIKRIKLGVITFDPDDANDITVQLQKLRTVAGISKVFRIETIGHAVYFGKMIPADQAGYVNIIAGIDTASLPVQEITMLYPFLSSFRQRFSGTFNLGFNFTKSSSFGRLNFDSKLNYLAKKEEISFTSSLIHSITDTAFTRDREDVGLKYNHYFSPAWFGTLLLKYQRNIELGLLRRYQQGIGAGNKFITSKHVYAWTRCGVVFNQEKYIEEDNSGTLTELFGQLEFNFFRFTRPEISLALIETAYYGPGQDNRVRNDAQVNISWEIVNDLSLTLSAYTNFDSKPPSSESKKFDYGIVFGLGFSF